MGYCVSEADVPDLPFGAVNAEIRRESFVLTGEEEYSGRLELDFADLNRLIALAQFIKKTRKEEADHADA